jgi:hypothetical protein
MTPAAIGAGAAPHAQRAATSGLDRGNGRAAVLPQPPIADDERPIRAHGVAVQRPSNRYEVGFEVTEQKERGGVGDTETDRAERVLDGLPPLVSEDAGAYIPRRSSRTLSRANTAVRRHVRSLSFFSGSSSLSTHGFDGMRSSATASFSIARSVP